jgi:hypothetical protein
MMLASDYDDDAITLLEDAPQKVLGAALVELAFLQREEGIHIEKVRANLKTTKDSSVWLALYNESKARLAKINETRTRVLEVLKKPSGV